MEYDLYKLKRFLVETEQANMEAKRKLVLRESVVAADKIMIEDYEKQLSIKNDLLCSKN